MVNIGCRSDILVVHRQIICSPVSSVQLQCESEYGKLQQSGMDILHDAVCNKGVYTLT